MLTLPIDQETERRLEALGATNEDSKIALLRKALLEALEDMEDLRMAEAVLSRPGRRYTLGEVEREVGIGEPERPVESSGKTRRS